MIVLLSELLPAYTSVKPDGVDERYSTIANRWPVEFEVCDLLYGLVRVLKPKRVIDLGTNIGFSAAAIGLGLRDNALALGGSSAFVGSVVTVDVKDMDAVKFWRRVPGISKYITFMNKSSTDKSFVDSLGSPFDIVFIDTLKVLLPDELKLYPPRLSPNGIALIHDSLVNTIPNDGKTPEKRAVIDLWLHDNPEWHRFTFHTGRGVDMLFRSQ